MAAVSSSSEEAGGGGGGGIVRREIMLFGVRVVVDPMRKCVSLNNLSDYEQPAMDEIPKIIVGGGERNGEDKNETDVTIAAGGYASANDAVQISSSSLGNRERKRGIPWTEDEHKLFLLGLQKVGKGDWKGISRHFVKSRTPTQVASHAQKYFLRRSNLNRRRRRSSLFDMTAETVTGMHMEQDEVPAQENTVNSQSLVPETKRNPGHLLMQVFPATITVSTTTGNASSYSSSNLIPVTFQSQPFNLNKDVTNPTPLSLNLSLASSVNLNQQSNTRHSMMPSFSNGESNSSIIRVA